MNKLVKGGLFILTLATLIFSVVFLMAGGLTGLGIFLFSALGIGSALVAGSTGWDGIQFLINYFKSDEKAPKKDPKIDEKKDISANLGQPAAVTL